MSNSDGLLAGRTAVVTGGTLGIGRGIADVLRSHGADVAVTGVTKAECEDARKDGYRAYVLDVRDGKACHEVIAQAAEDLNGLSILASNAGVYPQASIEQMTDDDIEQIFAINVTGMIHVVQAATPFLRDSEHGRIVVTSSITGNLTGFPAWAHYGATKAAQMGFVRSAAIELAPARITVNAVLPGNIVTPGLQALGEEYMGQMARSVPLGFLGEPRDIGEAAAFLASDGARYVTGQAIIVDGGQVLPESPEALDAMK